MQTFILKRWCAIAVGVVISVAGLVLAVQLEKRVVAVHRNFEAGIAREQAFYVASEIQRTLAFHKMLADSIASAVIIDPSLGQDKFEALVAPFFRTSPGILNIGLAKGSTVRFVYPFEDNKNVIGLDYLRTPSQVGSFMRVRDTRQPDFAGPVYLMQGGRGYIQRVPVYLPSDSGEDRFWGIVSVVTGEEELIRLTMQSVHEDNGAIVTALPRGSGPARFLWGDAGVLDKEPVSQTVNVNGAQWRVSIAPTGGWEGSTTASRMTFLLTLAATALLLVFIFWARHLFLAKKRSWEQLAEAIEVIDDGFALYDPDDRLVTFNSRFSSYYNASSDLIRVGSRFEDIVRGSVANGQYREAEGREEEWIAERLARHRTPQGSFEQLLDDGRWLKVSEAKMPDGSTVGFRVDITELKKALEAAEKANSVKSEFLNTVSHEIRTPLSAIIGFSTMIQNVKVMPEYGALVAALKDKRMGVDKRLAALKDVEVLIQRLSRRIDANGKQLLNVINDILYWNRSERLEETGDFQPVAVDEIARAVAGQLSGVADEKGIDLVVDCAGAEVAGDAVRLKQMILNLVGNALKFTEQGVVRLSVRPREDTVEIEVSDTGCGIPPESFGKIFDSFTQLDSGLTRRFGGLGLGLTISRDIAEKHGGNITVTSEPGVGSTFLVTLPAGTHDAAGD